MGDELPAHKRRTPAEPTIALAEHTRIVEMLEEELRRKERIIDALEHEKNIAVSAAIKAAAKSAEIQERIEAIQRSKHPDGRHASEPNQPNAKHL